MRSCRPVVRDEAAHLLGAALGDRLVLITGATGWFGSTAVALLDRAKDLGYAVRPPLLVASSSRLAPIAGLSREVLAWGDLEGRGDAPAVVLNFAFLTRGKEAALGSMEYRARNEALTKAFVDAASNPAVEAALTVSSGAAIQAPEGPEHPIGTYGELKRAEEAASLSLVSQRRSVVVARAWSVSGALATPVRAYALSSMIQDGLKGRIEVAAPGFVFRRYCGVDDYLSVCIADALAGRSGIIDSGGPLTEMRELASAIATCVPGGAEVLARDPDGTSVTYASDGHDWVAACDRHRYRPADLSEQIRLVVATLADQRGD